MKKRILAFMLCAVMIFSGLPLVPVGGALSVIASAEGVNTESLQTLFDSIPLPEKWESLYLDSSTLAGWYEEAQKVLENPSAYSQNYADSVEASLKREYAGMKYHTQNLAITQASVKVNVGSTYTFTVAVEPKNAADEITWSSSDPSIVSVSQSGKITVEKYSASAVTVTAVSNGHKDTCKVYPLNPIGGVKLTSPASLYEGQSQTLKVRVVGKDSSAASTDDYTLTWDSSEPTVASVSDGGVLTAKKKGTTVISVTAKSSNGSFTAKSNLRVDELVEVTSLKALTVTTSGKLIMTAGETETFKVSISPANASIKNLTWKSSDTSVLTVKDKGYSGSTAVAEIAALKAGSATLKFYAKDGSGKYGYVTVTVKPKISSISAETAKVVAPTSKSDTIKVKILPADAGNQVLSYTSSNPDICDVNYDGKLLPKKKGVCTIYIRTTDGSNLSAQCKVRVEALASAVAVSKSTVTINTAQSYALKATVRTADGTTYNDFIEWTSENTKIATVDANGKVTGRYPGKTVIRARAIDGTEKSAVCAVTVNQPVNGVTLPAKLNLGYGAQYTMKPVFNPTYASNKTVKWYTSDSSVVTVSSSGVITGKKVGSAVISCKTVDGGYVAKCTVTVIIPTKSVALDRTRASVYVGKSFTLKGTVSPSNATNKTLKWSSSDTSVATVSSSGVVTGVKGGSCVITCKNSGGQSAFCTVTVVQKVTGVTLNRSSISLYTGKAYTLTPTVLPATATDKRVTWTSSNSRIATVDANGKVTGVAKGVAEIVAMTVDGKFTAKCTVTVTKKIDVTGVKLNKTAIKLNNGSSYQLDATVSPSNASEMTVTWSSNNTKVATVSSKGLVKAVGNGSATITVKTRDGGFTAKCTVNVSSQVTGIRVSPSECRLALNNSKSLVVNIFPSDASNKNVVWTSSNPKVVSVNSKGQVKALKAGNATVTATTVDGGYSSSCDFTVYIPVSGVQISSTKATVPKGENILLTANVLPKNASNNSLRWSSSDSSIVSVEQSGQLKGKKVGTAVITVSTVEGNFSDTCLVSVVQLAEKITLDYTELTLYAGKSKTIGAKIKPSTTTNQNIIWSTSNKKVAKVDSNGRVTAVAGGTATIKATSGDGKTASTCKVTVIQYAEKVTISPASIRVREGQYKTLTAAVSPKTATDSDIIWRSSNTNVVKVNSKGLIKGIAKGTATIYAYSASKKVRTSCKVEVIKSVTGVSLNYSSIQLNVGKKLTLKPSIKPSDAYYQQVTWKSSNYDVADVSTAGTITAKSPGYAEITVRTADGGYQAVCRVLVVQPVTSVALNAKELYLEAGTYSSLKATVKPSNASDKSLVWSTSDKSVVQVSQKGTIKAVKTGTVTVTVKSVSGSKTASCTIHVVRKVKSITLNKSDLVLYLNSSVTLKAYVTPSDATVKTVKWYSSDTSVLRVNSKGTLTPVKPGKAVITAKTVDGGLTARCTVSVEIPATSLKLNKTSMTLYSGKTYTLTATIAPSNTTNKTIQWTSSNTKVATVNSKGVVTAIGGGKAVITAKTSNGLTKTCTVTVLKSVSGVSLNKTSVSLYTGATYKLTASVAPADASNKKVAWLSSDTSIVTVDESGNLKALKAGKAVVRVKTADGGFKAYCTVNVLQHVTSVKLDKASLVLKRGEKAQLTATVLPADATNKGVKWVSSDPSVVSVSVSGAVTANAVGSADVSVVTDDGNLKAVCRINVYESVTGVSLDISEKILYIGEVVTAKASVSPSDASNKSVIWSSSDASVANVGSDGKITALKVGTAEITAKTSDGGFTAKCKITVRAHVSGIALDQAEITVNRGEVTRLTASVEPKNSYDKTILWKSEDEQIATVQDGTVTAVSKGQTVIIAESRDGGFKASCTVTVLEPVTGIELSADELTVFNGQSETLIATVKPDDASDKRVTWTSSDKTVATVSNGTVTGVSGGTALITAETADGKYAAVCHVTVNMLAEEIVFDSDKILLARGDETTLKPTVLPENTFDKSVSWASDDETVATVDENGVVTAVSAGTATITCKAVKGNAVAQLTVEVYEPVTGITVSGTDSVLWVGEETTLTAEVLPENATNKTLVWSSDDESVAVVENGVVTAKKAGTALISAASFDGKVKGEYEITVRQQVTEIRLSRTQVVLNEGEEAAVTADILPENAYNKDIVWKSENDRVATVDGGKITAVEKGECDITVTSADGFTVARCLVTVQRPVVSVNISNKQLHLEKGESYRLSASVFPVDASDPTIQWISSNPQAVSVSEDGTVTALAGGTAVITAQSCNEAIKAECAVTVDVVSTAIRLDLDKIELWENETAGLSCTLSPADVTDTSVTWTSDNEDVATVENGRITAKSVGTAVITAKANDSGLTASCTVSVSRKTQQVVMEKTEVTVENGEAVTLQATVLPVDATYQTLTWSTSDSKVALVDESGTVTAVGVGTAIVTATTKEGGHKAVCIVTVTQKPQSITLDKQSLTLTESDTATLTASYLPVTTTYKELTWETSDDSIATVQDGKVTAVSLGTAVITVKSAVDESVLAHCEVRVLRAVQSVTLDKHELTLEVSETAKLNAAVMPDTASDRSVTWSTSDERIVSVDENGNLTAIGVGTATVTVITRDGEKKAACVVTVTQKPQSITLDKQSLTLTEGDAATLTASYLPTTTTYKELVWETSDDSVATVQDGKVTAVSLGTAVIAAKSAVDESVVAHCEVRVLRAAQSVTLDKHELTLEIGEKTKLNAAVMPDTASNQNVTWSTSDDRIVSVDENGNLTAISVGTAMITVQTEDGGFVDVCLVTVKKPAE